MTYRLVFRPQAFSELLSARDWYEAHRAGLGYEFVAAVEAEISTIARQPLAYPCVHDRTRRAALKRFPYADFFRVLENEIVVLGVIHGHRDPRTWQSRR